MNNNRLEEKRNGGKKKELLYYIKNQAIRVTKDFKKFMQNLDVILTSLNIEHKGFLKYASYDPDLDFVNYFDDIDIDIYRSYPNALREIDNEKQSEKLQDLADLVF